ncbi:MAG: hypothetical protein R3253_02715 [Longimicrobiales bacterium]|nr:hypothetical protein [Longimicrobiales bacterium]
MGTTVKEVSKEARHYGWKNRETWNVALWLANDEGWYRLVRGTLIDWLGKVRGRRQYMRVVEELEALGITETPDGVSLRHPKLSMRELNAHVKELCE